MNAVMEQCSKHKGIFIISGDAGLGVFDEFQKKHPSQFLNLGVAEQNMIGFAAGMSLSGYKVYVYNIIPFVLYRCYEQVRNDICYQRLPVTLVGIGSGVSYAPQGMTHYAIEDIGIAQTMPNLTVFSPIDPIEAQSAATYSVKAKGPAYARLAKKGEPKLHHKPITDITQPLCLHQGQDIALVCHGSIGPEVVKARELLEGQGISPIIISIPMVQPLSADALFEMLSTVKHVVSIEEHYAGCGLGSIIGKEYLKRQPSWKYHVLGISDRFVHEIKDTAAMREYFGISAGRIAEFIEGIL